MRWYRKMLTFAIPDRKKKWCSKVAREEPRSEYWDINAYLADAKCIQLSAKSILFATTLIFERQNSINCIAIKTQVKSKLVMLNIVVIVQIIVSNINLYIYWVY